MHHYPKAQGLYDPRYEKDSCGVGFIAHVKGQRSHQLVADAYQILCRMSHRSACGAEANSGDGAGVLTAIPHDFFFRVMGDMLPTPLPAAGRYAAGIAFLPQDKAAQAQAKTEFSRITAAHGQRLLAWRSLPTAADAADLSASVRACEPLIEQVFIAAADGVSDSDFERLTYAIRKQATHRMQALAPQHRFYLCSLSPTTIVYKGQLTPQQLYVYYPDLQATDYTSHLAMVHSRFSTNTFPSWERAQPNRISCHNGEINTIRGNINWMQAREGMMESELLGDNLARILPIIEHNCSDSGVFDNSLECLLMAGRSPAEALMMMIPEAWENDHLMAARKRDFYEYHACLMEPWDGPASILFTNGHCIGAVLDRNGLRPSRVTLTHDDRLIVASEVGVLPLEAAMIKRKTRLQPGQLLVVDFERQAIIHDAHIKQRTSQQRPYGAWLQAQRFELDQLPVDDAKVHGYAPHTVAQRLRAFGYTHETMQFMLLPMVIEGRDPVGSMGNDSALACLSERPRLLYDYFKQLFAQVTNPAIDSIREEWAMSLQCYIGPEGNLLTSTAAHAKRLRLAQPLLDNRQLAALKHINQRGFRAHTIDICWDRGAKDAGAGDGDGLEQALARICAEAEQAIDNGYSLIVLCDRGIDHKHVPSSALLACGAVHHHLIRCAKRTRIGIVVETGEAREVHHFCLLAGYGADAINPYLAFESLWQALRSGQLALSISDEEVVARYIKAALKGILKVIAKMGISTLRSYKGAQIFEAVGLHETVVKRCFRGTASRLQGVDFKVLAEELQQRHDLGYALPVGAATGDADNVRLPNPGEFHYRLGGESHAWQPTTIAALQAAARSNSLEAYKRYASAINQHTEGHTTLRGLMRLREAANGDSVALAQVEPAAAIVRRFCSGAMSFGSLSAKVHETLAIAMNRIGARSNSGEGGEDAARYHPDPNGDCRRSAIKQVASGRFGVTLNYLINADELQIKVAQGAKPGEGGELPKHKVDAVIARIRHSTPGVGLISPPPHHDIYSIEDLAQLIYDLKNANPKARISVKLVSEVGIGAIAAGVVKAHADHILISGHDGGTGASPLTSIRHAGLPWELGLAEAHQTLVHNDLRSRVTLQTDSGLRTGRDVVIAALLGAEEFGFATAPLISLGCIMMRKCHLNTCPVGITTQDPRLQKKFSGVPEQVINYLFLVAEEAREELARLGFCSIDEAIGRSDALVADADMRHWKSAGIDLSPLLENALRPRPGVGVRCTTSQDHGLSQALDHRLIAAALGALQQQQSLTAEFPIHNADRAVGTMLSHTICKRYGAQGLPDNTITLRFVGSAGQSFAAWLAPGVTMTLAGEANDYSGKGLSGGRIAIFPPPDALFAAADNVIVGNVCLYGATAGEAYISGHAAERFAVRNSGAHAVVEGVGDHGCEYMSGGIVVVLGPTGRNFATGMSGGIAYVLDLDGHFAERCNTRMVMLSPLAAADLDPLQGLIRTHVALTHSVVGRRVLANWHRVLAQFVKVMPIDYMQAMGGGNAAPPPPATLSGKDAATAAMPA